MKYPAGLREYRTSPVDASVTSTPQAPLSGPAADSADSARCRNRSTSGRAAGLTPAAPAGEFARLDGRDCPCAPGAHRETTTPKRTHPTRSTRNFRCNTIDTLLWITRKEKTNVDSRTLQAICKSLNFSARGLRALHEDLRGHMIAVASSPASTLRHFKE